MNYITSRNWEQLTKVIIKYSKLRYLLALCRDSVNRLENKEDVDDIATTLTLKANEILTRTSHTDFVGLEAGFIDFWKDVETMIESGTDTLGLPTGFPTLDNILSGLCGGKLYIIGARPAVGKSALAQQIAEYVAQEKNVLFFSLEMINKEYVQRAIQRVTGYSLSNLATMKEKQEEILEQYTKAGEELSHSKLKMISDTRTNLHSIERYILQCKQQFGSCDLVIIDYLQLMSAVDNARIEDYKKVTENSRGLKELSMKYNVPILALCQLSRSLEIRADKRPVLSDLRDSGAIEQDADVVMFLYRDEVYNVYNQYNQGKAELIIAKNRGGRSGTSIRMKFIKERTQFTEGW
jgi:replicative DNA helicase